MRRKLTLVVLVVMVGLGGVPVYIVSAPPAKAIQFPDGKRFAFSIIDDTDMTTLERIRPIYDLLDKYGLRTTKTVWVYNSNEESHDTNRGDSLRDPTYRRFVLDLQVKGFEIALHGVRGGSSRREETLSGLNEFRSELGQYPRMYVNHSLNKENLYWGRHVFAIAPYRWLGAVALRYEFSGHEPESPYFWGGIAKQHIEYVRRFTYPDINLLNVNPSFPYRLADKPYVNYWFPTANGDRILEFAELLKTENLARLDREGGVCLVYAHLGAGSFNKPGGVDPRFEARLKELISYNGWFVPASQILDHLRRQPSWNGGVGFRERLRLDTLYLLGQILPGFSR